MLLQPRGRNVGKLNCGDWAERRWIRKAGVDKKNRRVGRVWNEKKELKENEMKSEAQS